MSKDTPAQKSFFEQVKIIKKQCSMLMHSAQDGSRAAVLEDLLINIDSFIVDWQDIDRIYTENERQLDTRIDYVAALV